MAIKRVSELTAFNGQHGDDKIGYLSAYALTEKTGKGGNAQKYEPLAVRNPADCYGEVWFECSIPDQKGTANDIWRSRKISYRSLLSDALAPDMKAYLNNTNALFKYSLSSAFDEDYTYTGNKTFNGSVTIAGNVSGTKTGSSSDPAIASFGTYAMSTASLNTGNVTFSGNIVGTKSGTASNPAVANFGNYQLTANRLVSNGNVQFNGDLIGNSTNTKTASLGKYNTTVGALTATGDVTANSTMTVAGNTTIKGTLTVQNGTTRNQVTCGAVNATAVTATGDVTAGGNLYVGGVNGSNYQANIQTTAAPAATGTVYAKFFSGSAYRAFWGDLAEKYLADAEYTPGTLVKFGGTAEITIADGTANAIVSDKPAFTINDSLEGGTPIALAGRVPVRTIGPVTKFDVLMPDAANPGCAKVWDGTAKPIGRALESNQDPVEKLVLCATQFNIA